MYKEQCHGNRSQRRRNQVGGAQWKLKALCVCARECVSSLWLSVYWNHVRWIPCRALQCDVAIANPHSRSVFRNEQWSEVTVVQVVIKQHRTRQHSVHACTHSRGDGSWGEVACLRLWPHLQINLSFWCVSRLHFMWHLFIPVFIFLIWCHIRDTKVPSFSDISTPQGQVVSFQAAGFHGCNVTYNTTSKAF